MKRRIVVIGGVAAGPSAASKAKRVNPDADVVLYEAGDFISYGVCEIPYYISGEVNGAEKLVIYTPERLQKEKGVLAFTHHLVEEIRPAKKEISVRALKDRTTFTDHYDKLIIATGCCSKKIGIKGEDARNVFHIKTLTDAYALKKFIEEERPRSAAIIGAGFIGMEMADALSKYGIDVTVVHRSSKPMSVLEEPSQKIILEELERNNVRFIPHATVEWFGVGAKQNVVAVGTKNETIETDLVIVAVGVEPNADLARDAGIKLGKFGGITTNDQMNVAGAENIYAAGDCCELKNSISKKMFYQSLATTASKTGWVAGENAAGKVAHFKGAFRALGVRIFNTEVAQVGLTMKEALELGFAPIQSTIAALSKVGMMPRSESLTITTIADKKSGRLLGA
ncbi:MAG: FAD-dependent oxidoreductase, partial [Bacteroidota bacterium]|nr:FAD-dependent oxidoreductase [Bacteroidota bacterium]